MRYVRVTTIIDEAIGDLGFTLKKNNMVNDGSHFMTGGGLLIAHDLIEHQQGIKKLGLTLEDEIIAYGGIVYVRGQTGHLGGKGFRTAEEVLAGELAQFFDDYYHAEKPIRKFYGKNYEPGYEFDMIDDIVHRMERDIRDSKYAEWKEYQPEKEKLIPHYLKWITANMRYGAWMAEKRFKDEYYALGMFQNIERAVDNWKPEYEGQEFILGYDRNRAIMRPVNEEY